MRQSFQDTLSENVIAEPRACDGCGVPTPAWALYRDDDSEPWQCAICLTPTAPAAIAAPIEPWDTDLGQYLKAERNIVLDGFRWTIMPDSPLTAENQAEWVAWMRALHRMTVDFQPSDWSWPARPDLEFQEM